MTKRVAVAKKKQEKLAEKKKLAKKKAEERAEKQGKATMYVVPSGEVIDKKRKIIPKNTIGFAQPVCRATRSRFPPTCSSRRTRRATPSRGPPRAPPPTGTSRCTRSASASAVRTTRAPSAAHHMRRRTVRRVAPWLCVCVCMLLCGAAGVVSEGGTPRFVCRVAYP